MNTSRIERIPPVRWAADHPRIAAWIVLSLGMVILLVIEAREVGLLPLQWLALIIACVLVAGACVWIISWEGDDEDEDAVDKATVAPVTPTDAAVTTPVTTDFPASATDAPISTDTPPPAS